MIKNKKMREFPVPNLKSGLRATPALAIFGGHATMALESTMQRISFLAFFFLSLFGGNFCFVSADAKDPQLLSEIPISTTEQLQRIGRDALYPLEGKYILMNDIDASETKQWRGGMGFEPIGLMPTSPFSGSFDGNNLSIRNVYIHRTDGYGAGLFGSMTGVVKNLNLVNVNIRGSGAVGALARGCTGIIKNCTASGIVTGENTVGGLVGIMPNASRMGDIQQSSSACTVICLNSYAGGLVGSTSGIIKDCYAAGAVSVKNHVGGFAGRVEIPASVSNSYAVGPVKCEENFAGGFAGDKESAAFMANCYYDEQTTGQSDHGKGIPRTTLQMNREATFINWDFGNTWKIEEGLSYPVLRHQD